MRDDRFSCSRTSIDAHTQTKIDAFLRQMRSFHNQISIKFLVARCRKHCWSASRAFSHSFCPQNVFVALKIVAGSQSAFRMRWNPNQTFDTIMVCHALVRSMSAIRKMVALRKTCLRNNNTLRLKQDAQLQIA